MSIVSAFSQADVAPQGNQKMKPAMHEDLLLDVLTSLIHRNPSALNAIVSDAKQWRSMSKALRVAAVAEQAREDVQATLARCAPSTAELPVQI